MATKSNTNRYIPTTYMGAYGGAGGSARLANSNISNGVVAGTGGKNLTSQAYPSSRGTSSGGSSSYALRSSGGSSSGTRSSGGSGGSSSSSSASYDGGYDDGAYSALLAAYAQKQNDYEEYLRQQREAAQNAYNRGMNALNSAYDSQMGSLSSNLNETRSQLANQYNRSKQNVNDDAANSLRQAYINSMLSKRNLGQQMSAQGLTGGASETTMANMLNNYGNARNNINTTANSNLANLEGNYSNSLSQAMQAYNSAVANANQQKSQQIMALENALANNEISALGNYQSLLQRDNENYLDLLKSAIANSMKYAYNPTKATNSVNAVALNQASNPALTTNYQAIKELMDAYSNGNNNAAVTLASPTASNNNYLAAILSQLR